MSRQKQYVFQLHSGYVESQSIAALCLYTVHDMYDEVTPEELLLDFKRTIQEILPSVNEERESWGGKPFTAGELFRHMLTTDCDQVGEVYELLEANDWYFNPDQCYIAGIIVADNVDSFLDSDLIRLPGFDLYREPRHEVRPSPLSEEELAELDDLPDDDDDT